MAKLYVYKKKHLLIGIETVSPVYVFKDTIAIDKKKRMNVVKK